MMQEAAQAPELKVRELIEQVSGYYPAPRDVEDAITLAACRRSQAGVRQWVNP
jgi:hypothetical protein